MGTATGGDGTTISIDGVTVRGLLVIPTPARAREMVDTTDLDDEWETQMPAGAKKLGEIQLQGNYNPNDPGQLALEAAFSSEVASAFVVQLPITGGESWTFSGFVKQFDVGNSEKKGILKVTATIAPTGAATVVH